MCICTCIHVLCVCVCVWLQDRAGTNSPLDFEVVGGLEYGSEIFVASVKSESMPDRAGLLVGDQVRGEGREGEGRGEGGGEGGGEGRGGGGWWRVGGWGGEGRGGEGRGGEGREGEVGKREQDYNILITCIYSITCTCTCICIS